MSSLVINILRFDILNMHPAVYWGLGVIWILMLVSAIMSVRSLPIFPGKKVAWIFVIVAIPILGLGIYALRCLFSANWDVLKPFFRSRQLERKALSIDPVAKA